VYSWRFPQIRLDLRREGLQLFKELRQIRFQFPSTEGTLFLMQQRPGEYLRFGANRPVIRHPRNLSDINIT
jgi:hypothetical protein